MTMSFQTGMVRLSFAPTRSQCLSIQNTCLVRCAGQSRSRGTGISALTSIKRHHTTDTQVSQKSSWTHPIYSKEQILAVRTAHRQAHTWQDRTALISVRLLRWGMDLVSGYRSQPTTSNALSKSNVMTEEKWITRFIFLESVAGVPGMVAGMLRHLKSIRRMRRDNGWIETLLEEAYNERMHLLTFLKLASPGPLMRLMVLGAQCVFFSGFSLAYLISPQICHRFVGYLEEEAVITYTKAIQDFENGHLPAWEELQAPAMAVKYWAMPEGQRCMRSLLLYVRADEAKHRDVNHTLGNLDQDFDKNPFSAKFTVPVSVRGVEKRVEGFGELRELRAEDGRKEV